MVITEATYLFAKKDIEEEELPLLLASAVVVSWKNSWKANLPRRAAVSRVVRAKADTANATKVFPAVASMPKLVMKVARPVENTFTGPPFNSVA